MRVGPERRAHVTDLVREAYLEGMKRVRDVLDHLRRPHCRVDEWRGDVGVERAEHGGSPGIVAPDQGKRGMREVSQRGALPHELRVHGDAQLARQLPSHAGADSRDEHALRGTGEHSASKHDGVWFSTSGQRLTDLLADALERGHPELPVGAAGGADTNQAHIGLPHGLRSRDRGPQSVRCDELGQELTQPRLHHRRCARIDSRDLFGVDINADHLMPRLAHTRGGHTSHVAEAEHANAHDAPPPRT